MDSGNRKLTERQCEVIAALAFSGMREAAAGRKLGCSRGNICNQMRKIREKTGKDPRDFFDLHDLYEMAGGNE